MALPQGRFAFTVVDDTDVATVANVAPLYALLADLGFRTTKTVWPLPCPEGSRDYAESETLADPHYLEWVRDLTSQGFEVTWHGATMESSRRERTLEGLETFRSLLGHRPRIHVNHGHNQENVFWGPQRVDAPWIRALLRLSGRGLVFGGDDPQSPYYWGDELQDGFDYVRNLTFTEINLMRVNPSMPYRDPRRDLGPLWFSASDANDVDDFNALISESNQDRLEAEGGVCIVATHFGKGFVDGGVVHPRTRSLLERLASKDGWFPTTGELLDWMRARRSSDELPPGEWRSMQRRWARDLLRRRFTGWTGGGSPPSERE